MQAILLVGGKGTRLAARYPNLPKALVPVAGKPILQRQLDWLVRDGIRDIHLATGHLGHVIEGWIGSYPRRNLKISHAREPRPLGTGGALKFCQSFIRSEPFLVLNGDSLLPNLRFPALIDAHHPEETSATVAVTRIEHAGRYGTVEFDKRGCVTHFREKKHHESGWVNGGVYVLSREVIESLPAGSPVSLEETVFPELAAQRRLGAFCCPPPLLDMGTGEGLQATESYFA
jgi:mannose-1-phosphate guanylyltransferase